MVGLRVPSCSLPLGVSRPSKISGPIAVVDELLVMPALLWIDNAIREEDYLKLRTFRDGLKYRFDKVNRSVGLEE